MNKFIINLFFLFRRYFFKNNWDKRKIRILIFEKNNRRRKLIEKSLYSLDRNIYQFKIITNKLNFFFFSKGATIIYAYNISQYINISSVKLFYIPIVGANSNNLHDYSFKIVNIPNFSFEKIAEYIFSSVLSYERNILTNLKDNYYRKWIQTNFISRKTLSFTQLKIGIIGYGKIGRKTAQYFRLLGSELHIYDSLPIVDLHNGDFSYTNENWENMLKIVDYLILSINEEDNIDLLNEINFRLMNKNLCLVNVSRGSIINEKALISYLEKGLIRGAILDVFNSEPLSSSHIFWDLPNVVVTPHISGNIDLVFDKIVNHFVKEVKCLNS